MMFICEVLNAINELCPWFFDMGDIVYKWIWRICLGREILYGTPIDDKLNKFDNRMEKSLSNHKHKHKKFMKFIEFIFISMIIGPVYVGLMLVKWTCVLTWKLFKFIFRIGR